MKFKSKHKTPSGRGRKHIRRALFRQVRGVDYVEYLNFLVTRSHSDPKLRRPEPEPIEVAA